MWQSSKIKTEGGILVQHSLNPFFFFFIFLFGCRQPFVSFSIKMIPHCFINVEVPALGRIHPPIRPVATYFQSSSCVIWHTSAFLSPFPFHKNGLLLTVTLSWRAFLMRLQWTVDESSEGPDDIYIFFHVSEEDHVEMLIICCGFFFFFKAWPFFLCPPHVQFPWIVLRIHCTSCWDMPSF